MNFKQQIRKIVVHSNLVEFFKELVSGAIRNQNLDTNEMAEFYLVHLLADFHKSDKIRIRCPKTGEDEPLALTYLRAMNATNPEKINLYKTLGDRTLYLSGFFSEHLESTVVGLKYYISMGGNSYTKLADSIGNQNPDLADLFHQLSEKFVHFVDILGEVCETAGMSSDSDLLRLYERWLETGSQRAAKTLSSAGIPLNKNSTENLQ